jgi:hypothetical protein
MAVFAGKTFNEKVFLQYMESVPRTRVNALLNSGALRRNADVANAFSGSQVGSFFAIEPFYGRIGGDAQNYNGSDDLTSNTTPTYERGMVVVGRMNSWTEKDFSSDITGGVDFVGEIARQVAAYWEDVDIDTLYRILSGVFAMSGTGDDEFVESHTTDISEGTGAAALVGATSLNTAIQKACGDNKFRFSMALMHSLVATNLENIGALQFLTQTDANGIQRDLSLATWNGRLVLVDDTTPYDPETGVYTTYLLGDGAFDFEDVGVKEPFEAFRDPFTAGGQDTLCYRQRKVFAPNGISFTKESVASFSPTDAELADGENWTLVREAGSGTSTIDLKSIPIARILSLG